MTSRIVCKKGRCRDEEDISKLAYEDRDLNNVVDNIEYDLFMKML